MIRQWFAEPVSDDDAALFLVLFLPLALVLVVVICAAVLL